MSVTAAASAEAIAERTVLVSGVPMSALVASVPDPRLVIVALHGGAVSSAYYDYPEHPRVWDPSPAAMASVASLFTASPRVVTLLQPEAAHNLSRCRSAAAYHLKVFSFAEECALAREAFGATLPESVSRAAADTPPSAASGAAAHAPPPESPSLPTPPPGG